MILLHPTYFLSIASSAAIVQNEVCWEVHDNYQKQTYRNRTKICTDRGLHVLSIPIVHVGNTQGRQLYKEVRIDNSYNWQRQHWRTLETAYRTSPFFEYYEDDIRTMYDSQYEYLLEYNLKTIETICDLLQVEMPSSKSEEFQLATKNTKDYRSLVDAKKKFNIKYAPYNQVFGDRHNFIPNQSILDLIFNIGPEATKYLKQLKIDFTNV
ncbi:WbqC family protein [Maribacter aestuarii]|uniref:WbqC family protein n=1 Tax=Maribacter aestuarii TaxID=1130723 RepID=UPI00248B473A|nr:WbqC family protein [Maribacter aestuarii]